MLEYLSKDMKKEEKLFAKEIEICRQSNSPSGKGKRRPSARAGFAVCD